MELEQKQKPEWEQELKARVQEQEQGGRRATNSRGGGSDPVDADKGFAQSRLQENCRVILDNILTGMSLGRKASDIFLTLDQDGHGKAADNRGIHQVRNGARLLWNICLKIVQSGESASLVGAFCPAFEILSSSARGDAGADALNDVLLLHSIH